MTRKSNPYKRLQRMQKRYTKFAFLKRAGASQRIPLSNRTIKSYSSNVGMPLRKFAKMTYVDSLVFTPNLSGAHSSYTFNLNSCFDPNFSGGGHSVLGWTQLTAFYKQYRVHSANVKVQWSNGATNVFPVYVGCAGDKNGSLEAALETKLEATKQTRSKLLLINSREKAIFRETIKMKNYFSVKNVADDHQLQAVTTASPTLPAYYEVWAQFANGHPGTTSNAIIMNIQIDYNVELFDPVELAQS